jgi:UDP-glucose 4-epimerase
MKIFVTGGAGFVGSWVAEELIKSGYQVTVLDNLTAGNKKFVPNGAKLIQKDIRDKSLNKYLKGHDAVIHLAAKTVVPESVKDPFPTIDVNLFGGINLIEGMRKVGIKKMVFSSTAAVYGQPKRLNVREDDPKFPINPYGASKLAFETLLYSYYHNYGWDVTMFRYFNPYGPRDDHQPETHAIANFIHATLEGKPIPLYWQGRQKRDFFYIEDIAKAHVLGLKQKGFHCYNLGSGKPTKVIDVVKMIEELTGKKSLIDDLGERLGDPEILAADVSKVRKELGWVPKTDMKAGLKKTINWFEENLKTIS